MIDLQVLNSPLNLAQTGCNVFAQPLLSIRCHQTEQVTRLRVVVAIMLAMVVSTHGRGVISHRTLNVLLILGGTTKTVRLIVWAIAAVLTESHAPVAVVRV